MEGSGVSRNMVVQQQREAQRHEEPEPNRRNYIGNNRTLVLMGVIGFLLLVAASLQVAISKLEQRLLERRREKSLASVVGSTKNNGDSSTKNRPKQTLPGLEPPNLLLKRAPVYQSKAATASMHWHRAVAALQMPDWDATVAQSQPTELLEDYHSLNGDSNLNGWMSLLQAANGGHAHAQYILANALAAGFWPLERQPTTLQDDEHVFPFPVHLKVQETFSASSSSSSTGPQHQQDQQQTYAWLLWHMAALAGHVEAAMNVGHRLLETYDTMPKNDAASATHRTNYCWNYVLPYYQASAHGIIDALEDDASSRAKVMPPKEGHLLHQVHLFGGTGSLLDLQNKPHESAHALQFYQVKADAAAATSSSFNTNSGTSSDATQAAYTLAHMYHHGVRGVAQNLTTALHYYKIAAQGGHWKAAGNAGDFYLWGIGTTSNTGDGSSSGDAATGNDLYKAYKYYRMGLPFGVDICRRKLEIKLRNDNTAFLCDDGCLNGFGLLSLMGVPMLVERDEQAAQEYFTLAKDQGNIDAPYNLAMMKLGYKTHFRSIHEIGVNGQTRWFASSTSLSNVDGDNPHFGDSKKTTSSIWQSNPTHLEWQSIMTDLTTAAGKGHIQAKHRLAMMYTEGVKAPPNSATTGSSSSSSAKSSQHVVVVPRDCDKALKNYRAIVEQASPQRSQRLRKAYKQYMAGDLTGSLRNYLAAAEAGSELAQVNGAFLLEQGVCLGLDRVDCAKAAVRLYKAAAAKGNAEASLRVGDFYYYGRLRALPQQQDEQTPTTTSRLQSYHEWVHSLLYPEEALYKLAQSIWTRWFGSRSSRSSASTTKQEDATATPSHDEGEKHTLQKDLEKAAQYYRLAANRENPRAHFNLGFLYEWGLGLKQDFPLAKRHYDLALTGPSKEAELAVAIALFSMNLHESLVKMYASWQDYFFPQEQHDDDDSGSDAKNLQVPAMVTRNEAGHPVPGSISPNQSIPSSHTTKRTKLDVLISHLLSWESLLILVLTFVLWVLLSHRRTQR